MGDRQNESETFTFRLTTSELDALKQSAHRECLPVSKYLRKLIRGEQMRGSRSPVGGWIGLPGTRTSVPFGVISTTSSNIVVIDGEEHEVTLS